MIYTFSSIQKMKYDFFKKYSFFLIDEDMCCGKQNEIKVKIYLSLLNDEMITQPPKKVTWSILCIETLLATFFFFKNALLHIAI